MTRRRWIADLWTATTATLTGDQALHLARVLRAEPGQIYDVVAGGFLHRAEITTVSEAEVHFTLHEELESDAALPLHLLLAVFKFDHMEWAIEKATELGIARITPILARRTEKHLAQSALKRTERWRRIVLEASKQSRRTTIPEVADPTPLKQALAEEKSPTRILLSETEQAFTLNRSPRHREILTKRSRHCHRHRPRRRLDPRRDGPLHPTQLATRHPRPPHPPRRNRRHRRHRYRINSSQLAIPSRYC